MPQKKGCIPWNKGKKGLQKAWNKGKKGIVKMSPETKAKMSESQLKRKGNKGKKHYNWKGDKCSYRSLHEWITNKLGKPETCEHCRKTGLKGQQIHWASKSGKYTRKDLSDWIRLCVKCHKEYDKSNKSMYNSYSKDKLRIKVPMQNK